MSDPYRELLDELRFDLRDAMTRERGVLQVGGVHLDIRRFAMSEFDLRVADIFSEPAVLASCRVHDRDTGLPTRLSRTSPLLAYAGRAPDAIAVVVRELLREMLLHELDEHLMVNGVRMFDPHRE